MRSRRRRSKVPAQVDRLNLGCGDDLRAGYLNVDSAPHHRPDLRCDVRDLGVLATDHYREVLALDLLEHLPRADTAIALAEWHRVLAPGGTLHLQVPSAPALLARLEATDEAAAHDRAFQDLFGTQRYPGDFHLAGFSDVTLIAALAAAGFEGIELQLVDGWLFDARAVKPNGDERRRVGISWGAGAYLEESNVWGRWRWFDRAVEVLAFNTAPESRRVSLSGAIQGGEGVLLVDGLGEPAKLDLGGEEAPVELATTLTPGAHRIRLEATVAPIQAAEDPRSLYWRLAQYRVSEE